MRKALTLIVASVLVFALVASISAAKGPDTAKVLIGFKGRPDPAVVAAVGGQVDYVYSIVPAVYAVVPAKAVEALKNNPLVDYVEYDGTCHIMAETTPWGITDVGAPTVWSGGNKGDNVKICIIDTGVDIDHPDLAYLGGYDYYNNDSNPDDDHGHGTHCAGIAAALDNDIGVIGVAPLAHLYACKVLSASGSGSWSTVAKGIDWARNNGMHVISMSLGGTLGSITLKNACDNAWNAGIVLSVAAGNNGNSSGTGDNVTYPARYDSCIAVAAYDSNHVRAYWSSTGPAVELAAPGVSIYSTYKGGTYTTMSGTSMACPHVTGVAALVKYAHWSYTNQQIRNAMDYTAIDLGAAGRDTWYGYGRVWAPGAVAY
ncbi:MAG: S8 family peptidase [Acetobacteraceae bacterium]|nr:S8 family peptidase [Acetobacteraceae bacterium]